MPQPAKTRHIYTHMSLRPDMAGVLYVGQRSMVMALQCIVMNTPPPPRAPPNPLTKLFLFNSGRLLRRVKNPQNPGGMAWEVPGASVVRFKKGDLVATVFPGLLTVSLLAAEGLPTVWVRRRYS